MVNWSALRNSMLYVGSFHHLSMSLERLRDKPKSLKLRKFHKKRERSDQHLNSHFSHENSAILLQEFAAIDTDSSSGKLGKNAAVTGYTSCMIQGTAPKSGLSRQRDHQDCTYPMYVSITALFNCFVHSILNHEGGLMVRFFFIELYTYCKSVPE